MGRRLAVFVSTTLLIATLVVWAPASSASPAVCSVSGLLNTSSGLYYPAAPQLIGSELSVRGLRTVAFSFGLQIGACLPAGTVTMSGTLSGYCGHSAGTGTTYEWPYRDHRFAFVNVGEKFVFTGGLTGVVSVFPDVLLAGNSCLRDPGAHSFLAIGYLMVKTHCNVVDSSTTITPATLPPLNVGPIRTETQGVQAAGHACVGTLPPLDH
jgi:hypothetical protein